MKFYSEITKKIYDTQAEVEAAERKVKEQEAAKAKAEKEKKETRAKRAKEVENALQEVTSAATKAKKLLIDFTNDYGYFHTSYTFNDDKNTNGVEPFNFLDLVTSFLQ